MPFFPTGITTGGPYQPLNGNLTEISALTPGETNLIQYRGGQWNLQTLGGLWDDLMDDPAPGSYAYTALPFTITNDKRLLGRDSALPPFTAMEIEIGSGLDLSAGVLSVDTSSGFVTGITGTLNQVAANGDYVNPQTGPVTLSLPQDIHTLATPTFGGLTLGSPLTAANGGTGLTGLGTGVATALGINVGSAGSFITNGGALGTPSSGTVTNLTGTASININGTVGATTPAAGSFTVVGIGTSSPGVPLHLTADDQTTARIRIENTGGGQAYDLVAGLNNVSQDGFSIFDATNNATRMHISSSGNVLFTGGINNTAIGATTPSTGKFTTSEVTTNRAVGRAPIGVYRDAIAYSPGSIGGLIFVPDADVGTAIEFTNAGGAGVVGSISHTSTTTSYNTSSDRRLKTNIRDFTGSAAIIESIRVCQYDWKTGEKDTVGFVAQELYEVYPAAVTKGDDGEDVTKPWAVDYSKLVPVLVSEIQALRARVAVLEN